MTVRAGILGATGAVGQRLIRLLDSHPDFDIAAVTASESSAGHPYKEAAKWRIDAPIPAASSNSGWPSSSWIHRWPTAPVAPRTPTRTVIV